MKRFWLFDSFYAMCIIACFASVSVGQFQRSLKAVRGISRAFTLKQLLKKALTS